MTVVICALPYLSRFDAVSNDARMQQDVLRKAGYVAHLYAELCDPGCNQESISSATFAQLTSDPATILVFQMCVAWAPLDAFLAQTKCKVVLRYQNKTPPKFFDAYDALGAHATRGGLAQMARIFHHPRIRMLMPGSPYTRDDALATWGAVTVPTRVVAPFMTLPDGREHSDDPDVVDQLKDGRLQLFFVGRWAPNKGHQHMVGVLNSYRELYGPKVCLTIAGSPSPNLKTYRSQIEQLIESLDLGPSVRLVGGIGERQLLTYLRHASAFLLTSEHEGFCVPVVEAQVFQLPVLALAQTAVEHTVGPGQLSFARLDYDVFATAAKRLQDDAKLRAELIAQGTRNAERFSVAATTKAFLDALKLLHEGAS